MIKKGGKNKKKKDITNNIGNNDNNNSNPNKRRDICMLCKLCDDPHHTISCTKLAEIKRLLRQNIEQKKMTMLSDPFPSQNQQTISSTNQFTPIRGKPNNSPKWN